MRLLPLLFHTRLGKLCSLPNYCFFQIHKLHRLLFPISGIMDGQGQGQGELLKELRGDLARKYQLHGTKIEQIWRSLGRPLREKALKAGAAEGRVLKTPTDRTMGNVYKVMPELNLRDIGEPESDFLLDILKHRATKSISEQYIEGVNGGPGDATFILESMRTTGLRHNKTFRYSFTVFLDEDRYGQSFTVPDRTRYQEVMAGMSKGVEAGLVVPQSTGELILERQTYLLQCLNILVEDILEIGSTTRKTKPRSKKPDEAATAALSKLSIDSKPEKLSVEDLLARALDQKNSLEDYVRLCRSEPEFLAHAVNVWFFCRPELLPDQMGRRLPLVTDKYISAAVFEVIHNAVIGAAVWGHISDLLKTLADAPNDRAYRATILQEIVTVCHFEYERVQKTFKRYVQAGSGSEYFKRVANVYDDGTPRVKMTIKPEALTAENPRVHYMLRLCQTDVANAGDWIKKLDDLHRSHPTEREEMPEREYDAFGDLAVTTNFIQTLSASLSLPPVNRRKGQAYVLKLKDLGTEVGLLKAEVDLTEFAVPIDNLLEPGMAEGALTKLDRFIVEKTGTEIGFLYQDLNEDVLSSLKSRLQQQKAEIAQNVQAEPAPSVPETPTPEVQVAQRKEKNKTRPAHSSVYSIAPTIESPTEPAPETAGKPFKVKSGTFEVFSKLFSRAKSRGSISWAAFKAAMVDLGFSIQQSAGSAVRFSPPPDVENQQPLTLHQPHKSEVEGYKLLRYASRLKREYGWNERSFEEAK